MHRERIQHRRWRLGRLASSCLIAAGLSLLGVGTGQAANAQPAATTPSLSHVFVIMEENNGYHDVIGNPAAPNLNYLASTFGVATDYFGVSPCCSEANYVGLLGGSTFTVNSDDAYWKNKVNAPSLISQLDQAGISWKAYLQSLPHPNYEGICYPEKWITMQARHGCFHDRGQFWSLSDSNYPRSWAADRAARKLGFFMPVDA
jgi:hypothetical protein